MSSRRTSDVQAKEGKDKKGLLTRMKTILKKSGESSSSSSSSPKASKRHSTMPETQPEIAEPADTGLEPVDTEPAKAYAQYEGATRIPRAQVHEDRTRRLGDNYGVEIEPSEWHSTEGDVYRVEKPIRVRIHRECHRCQTAFGINKQCPSCSHHYCTKCGRTPPKRTESQKRASRENREEAAQKTQQFAPIIPHYGLAEPVVITRPSKTGGQPLVHKVPRMRLRRSCHKCNTTFTQSTRVCERCGHRRCDDCPKTPQKKKKYPYGYPGDQDGPSSSTFHKCHECHGQFPPNAQDGVECEHCSHPKCATCPRLRRTRVEPEPNPELLGDIASRFEQLGLESQAR